MNVPHPRLLRFTVFLVPAILVVALATFSLAVAQGPQPSAPVPLQGPSVTPTPTPDCPSSDGLAPDQPPVCERPVIQGFAYWDVNRDGQPSTGDLFLPGAVVTLYGPSGEFIAEAVTNENGFYRFIGLSPIYGDETYTVVLTSPPPGYCILVSQGVFTIYPEDFFAPFCCVARRNFSFLPGECPTPSPPPRVTPTSTVPPPFGPQAEVPVSRQIHLPILNYVGADPICDAWIEVQNVGNDFTKAIVVFWGEAGACPPQCTGPLKVECSGLLKPGSTWNFLGGQVPSGAKSAVVFSASAAHVGRDVFADALCEALFSEITFNCDEYRRFKKAFDEFGIWHGFDFSTYPGEPLAVEVVRKCAGDVTEDVPVSSAYSGLSDGLLGAYDPEFGGFAYYAPLVYANRNQLNSWIYIHNAGIECTSVELWFKAQDDCLRATVCEVFNLAPGETIQYDAGQCVGPDWQGSVWIRSSQRLGVVVDQVGRRALMTYRGSPSQLDYTFQNPNDALFTPGSQVNYGPLIYREFNGWETGIQVQNLSSIVNAKVKVYFLDNSGDIITTVVDWICPRGSQTFFLPVINNLPGHFVGQVRVESQNWFSPGDPAVPAPNIVSVAQLIHYGDAGLTQVLEAVAYNLFSEREVFDWQTGSENGGVQSGVGLIGIPSFLKDLSGTGVTSEIAIQNAVPVPGFTDFAIYIYDQNGLLDFVCEKLNEKQVEYINLDTWGYVNPGFKGSAVISATYWNHRVDATTNLVGLAAVKIERQGTVLSNDIPGDEAAGSEGFPIFGPFHFQGPHAPVCPGLDR